MTLASLPAARSIARMAAPNAVPNMALNIPLTLALLLVGNSALAAEPPSVATPTPPAAMTSTTRTIQGSFDVQLTPVPATPGVERAPIEHLLLRKQFHGDLQASSLGDMLAFRSPVKGSAGYVAMERIEGRLEGRSGSFVVMHIGEMSGGSQQLTVRVVPDSGTGELTRLSGTMTLDVRDGKHRYEFHYQLPER